MKEVTLKSVYGKTLQFRKWGGDQVEVQACNSNGNMLAGMLISLEEIDKLRQALVEPKAPTLDTYFLIRQHKDTLKLKVMFANTTSSKEFTSKRAALEHQARMTRDHGNTYNFFVVKKEAK